ncbi:aldehyde dehydrogenase family protein [uncultured Shewanella sp.]|uniref:aldehyde dehydrogenase family protein n=1 Tax=uncultured Shewanella sp. TaxID=173975 RepID=UPI00262E6C8F|nr:aldehyde dehydrogenase family protein [uncultured Shewanella sp.]
MTKSQQAGLEVNREGGKAPVDVEQQTISPSDGTVYVSRRLAGKEEVRASVDRAVKAKLSWKATALDERKLVCQRAIDILLSHKEEVALELSCMMGRPIRYSGGELHGVAERSEYMISICDEVLATRTLLEKPGLTRYIKREPVGIVLVIAPWNYPFLTAVNAIIPALLAGNCVILKHSAQTPLCAERFYQAFKEAGLPEGIFQFLHLSHESTKELIASEAIDYVAFTGSVQGGVEVEKAAQGRFIGVGLELGGKDPAYVRKDADIEKAVASIVDGAFFNSGQSCCGIERVYVHRSVYDEFVAQAVALTLQYKLGRADDPDATLGPMVRSGAADFVRAQVKEAIAQGAVAHIDESLFEMSVEGTAYLAPQILTEVNHRMRVMREETFGPVMGIMKVSDDKQALELMNDSEFGLTACIFTKDVETGVALGELIETGTFFLNRCDYLDPALAWIGVKQSGRGCSLSQFGFDNLTRPKSFYIKHE